MKTKFFSKESLQVELLPNGKARLLEDIYYQNESIRVKVLKNFIFDGASIPKFFWSIIGHPFSFKLVRPAVVHDILYASEIFTRKFSDELFEEMLEVSGVDGLKDEAMFIAVRIGGNSVWDNHNIEDVSKALEFIEVEEIKS